MPNHYAPDPTPFQRRVYAACAQIPKGRVTTYQALATFLASHPRAVGQALKKNPYAPAVPCHRVITSGLQLGGFSGKWDPHSVEVQRKKKLLSDEGVSFGFLKPTVNEVLQDAGKLFFEFDAASLSRWEPPRPRE
jgi:methylated-DNA-[protein]-cysteine S-methyltransferase